MDSRMAKYSPSEKKSLSRLERNEKIYQNINKSELENFDISNNATILSDNYKNEIDVTKIKKILDTKYNEAPKRKSIRLEDEDIEINAKDEITKEYDINAILNKARIEKPVTYEEDRAKKMRDTQFDILKNLQIEKPALENNKSDNSNDLLNLISTITINEEKSQKIEDTDSTINIFNHLKAGNEIENLPEIKENIQTTQDLEQTFFSKSTQFDKKDFMELENEKGKSKFLTEVLVVVILIAFLVGIFIFLKSILSF